MEQPQRAHGRDDQDAMDEIATALKMLMKKCRHVPGGEEVYHWIGVAELAASEQRAAAKRDAWEQPWDQPCAIVPFSGTERDR